MATVERFEDLDVWKRARELGNLIYSFSESGDFRRDFGLRDQMRRAVVSIMSNIAEGFESRTQALFIEFLGRSKGSAGELRSQLYIALDQKIYQRSAVHAYAQRNRDLQQTASPVYPISRNTPKRAKSRRRAGSL